MLQFQDAVEAFRLMPADFQLGSLHPRMVAIDAQKDPNLRPVYWQYRDGDLRLLHFFHLTDNSSIGVKDVQSAYGYGGPLSNCTDRAFLEEADRAFAAWARNNRIIAEFLRFHPLVPHEQWYHGHVSPNRITVCIDLRKDLLGQYLPRRRRNIRRYEASGLEACEVDRALMMAAFPRMYSSNMEAVSASQEYLFPDAYFEALLSFEQADSWLVISKGKPIAGTVILLSPDARVAEYHLGARSPEGDAHQAMAGLLHSVALHYQKLGYERFYLGGGRTTAPNDSLLFFKEGFARAEWMFRTAARIYDMSHYQDLARRMPEKAATGRVLFYKD